MTAKLAHQWLVSGHPLDRLEEATQPGNLEASPNTRENTQTVDTDRVERRRKHADELPRGIETRQPVFGLVHRVLGERVAKAVVDAPQAARIVDLQECGPARREDAGDLL